MAKYQDVKISLFPSPKDFREFDTEDETAVANLIRKRVLPREKAEYYSVKVRVKRKADGKPDYLVAYMLRKDTYTADVVRVDVDAKFRTRGFVDDYYEAEEELEEEAPEEGEYAPGEYDFIAATPVPEIPTAKKAVQAVHEMALAAGLRSKVLLGAEATVANYKAYLLSGLRGFVNVGHGNTNEIVLFDGRLSAPWFQSVTKRLCGTVIYFNSCQVFNSPLQPAVMKAGARTFIGGIVNLAIGPSEEVCKCFWDSILQQGIGMGPALTACEKAKYTTTGAHGFGGDTGLFNFLTAPIDGYKVVLYGKNEAAEGLVAFIHCFHGSDNVMTCEFYADGSAMPENRFAGCRVGLVYPWSRFGAVLDVLRNEGPLYYGFIFSTKVGYVSTLEESAGEGEA